MHILAEFRVAMEHLQYIGTIDHLKEDMTTTQQLDITHTHARTHLALQVTAGQGHHAAQHCILDKCAIIHQLSRGECGDCLKEVIGCSLEVSDLHGVHRPIHLQPIPAVPVPSLLYEAVVKTRHGTRQRRGGADLSAFSRLVLTSS